MEEFGLGPNGALVYCMEYLLENVDWLEERLEEVLIKKKKQIEDAKNDENRMSKTVQESKEPYLIFDCPGQVELYTINTSLRKIVQRLTSTKSHHDKDDESNTTDNKKGSNLFYKLTCINLIDSSHIIDPSKFISVLLLSLKTMIHLELPHVNVLSKMDLIETFGKLPFGLDYYTEVLDLEYLLQELNEQMSQRSRSMEKTTKFLNLNAAICELLSDYGLVHFQTVCVFDKAAMYALLKTIDASNGYIYTALEESEIVKQLAGKSQNMDSGESLMRLAAAFGNSGLNALESNDESLVKGQGIGENTISDIKEKYMEEIYGQHTGEEVEGHEHEHEREHQHHAGCCDTGILQKERKTLGLH